LKRRFIRFALLLAFVQAKSGLTLRAQVAKLPVAPEPDILRHDVLTTWTTDQGLPQNFIRAITQTADGFLWVGTMNGLTRFDGLHFRGFAKDGPPELQDNIVALAPDRSNGLWIATATSLFHYTDQKFQPILLRGQPHYRVEAMARAQDGEVWLYTGGELLRSRDGALEPHPIPSKNHTVRDLVEASDHTLWLADGDSLTSIRGRNDTTRYPLAGVRMVYADSFGDLFAGDGHHLFRFNGREFNKIQNPGLGNFVSVLVDHRHQLWMASGGLHGISRRAGDVRETMTMADGLASNDVRILFEDRSHDIWLGTISGLQRLHKGEFTTYTALDGLPDTNTQFESIFQQKNGVIWVGSLDGRLARFDRGRWRQLPRAASPPAGQVRGFIEDGDVPSIAVADYGIFAFRGGRYTRLSSIPRGYASTPVRTADGSLWFSIDHRGLFRRQGTQLTHFGPSDGVADETIWSIAIDPNGVLFVGAGNRFLRWNQQRFETVLTSPSPLLSPAWPAEAGVSAGALNGLVVRTNEESRLITQKEGLPGSTVLDAISDRNGNLWLATTSVIARLSLAQWTAFAEHRIDRVEPEIFTQADGLRSNTVLPLNEITAVRSQDGRIWFATPRGISVIDPNLAPEPPVPAVMDSVIVDDQIQPARDLTVAPGQHRITFVYTTPLAPAPGQIRFRYRLSGWDDHWIEAGSNREVSYTALPPGSYNFEVTAISRENIPSSTSAAIHLHLKPFFWQTTWFLVLSIVAGAAIIAEITRRRTRVNAERLSLRFQERAAERERIAYQIHDTVIQDMIGAALQLEILGFQIADQPEKAGSMLDTLALRLRETIARSRNMVWSLHSTAVVQYSLVEVLRHAEAEFRLGELPRFELISSGELRDIHPLVRDEVYRICREALANAFRHSNAQNVHVIVRFLPEILEVEIGDDGLGIDEEIRLHGRPGHFGLPGMLAHAQRIGARISILSAPGQGTKILLRVKTREQKWHWFRAAFPAPHGESETMKGRPNDPDHGRN